MSFSVCIKCKMMVSEYEKYCRACIEQFGVAQDEDFHKRRKEFPSEEELKLEFEADKRIADRAAKNLKCCMNRGD